MQASQIAALGVVSRARRHTIDIATDEALIERIDGGDELAMRVLFGRYHVRVNRFVLRLVGNRALAEDLVSATFLAVWRHAGTFKARSTASTWLLSIARFKALSELRRHSHEDQDDAAACAIEDPADDPETAIQKKDRGDILRKCLISLSPAHREIIDLVYYHEKPIDEVAEIIGVPRNTVKTRVFYARKQLSHLLRSHGMETEH